MLMHASPHIPRSPASSQGRNIFSIFLLTLRALYMSPGPISVFIYSKVSFHAEKVKALWVLKHRNKVLSHKNQHSTSHLVILCIIIQYFIFQTFVILLLQKILISESRIKHFFCCSALKQHCQSTLCNKYKCPLLGAL